MNNLEKPAPYGTQEADK